MRQLEESFRILRLRVEDQAPIPSVVVVTSAQRGDGTTYVAGGLARAFAEFRHRTLLIDAHGAESGAVDHFRGEHVARLSVAAMFTNDPNDNVVKTLADLRAQYDVVIVDAPPVPGSSLALSLARAADGVLIAVRIGRRKSGADTEMMHLLAERRILGVVPTGRLSRPETPVHGALPQPVAGMIRRLLKPARRLGKALR